MKMTEEQIKMLGKALPAWAVKDHPTKKGMSAIHPMAIIDRLNEVFGVGGWNFHTEYIGVEPFTQNTKSGPRSIYMSAVKGILEIGDLTIEQFGGSSNDDMGDALKGGATDALTKIASYLGIGAEIYKGKGNVSKAEPLSQKDIDKARQALELATTKDELKDIWLGLSEGARADEGLKDYSRTLAGKLK